MIYNIKKLIKRNDKFYSLVLFYVIEPLRQFIFNYKRLLRQNDIEYSCLYTKLKIFRNKHKGKRCFIVATGPSLSITELDLLRNEITFSMNSIVMSFSKTQWRPTYYAIQDMRAYEKLKKLIIEADFPVILNGLPYPNKALDIKDKSVYYPLNLLCHNIPFEKGKTKFFTEFSDNAYNVVYDGYTITYSLLQLAVYMGIKEVYLLGVDCDYFSSQVSNHILYYQKQDDIKAEYLMKESYKVAKKYADENDIKIYNASLNSKLDVFEKVDLKKLF